MGADQLKGLGVALVTPFTSNGTVDYPALDRLVDHLLEGGVDYFVVLGTTAETPTLKSDEISEIIALVKKKVAGRKPIVLGCGGNDTLGLIEKIRATDFTGIDAILSVNPYYNKPNQRGLLAHFNHIADVSPVPVILYNIPGRTGVCMSVETTLELANHPNIIGTKEATGDLDHIGQIIAQKPADFLVISGDDGLVVPMVSMGGAGAISVIGNAYPAETVEMVHAALDNNFERAAQLHRNLTPIVKLLFAEGNPTGIKALMSQIGLLENNLRLPLVPASDELMASFKSILLESVNKI